MFWNDALDGCYHVYMDVGSNIGVQIRKLYEPQKYPGAVVHRIFNEAFGSSRSDRKNVCTIGFEPNPAHSERLKGGENG